MPKLIDRTLALKDILSALTLLSTSSLKGNASPHPLPGELIVSLTSYPARFRFLHLTIKSLLTQDMRPDRVVLWIAKEDMDKLPDKVCSLRAHGLEIRPCFDVKSYNKIIPTLEQWPNGYIITADDDLFYKSNWLRTIAVAFNPASPEIICRRAHLPTRGPLGQMLPYRDWQFEVTMPAGEPARSDLFPTGVGGVLYYPRCFADKVTDKETFMKICARADDVWLYWMGRMGFAKYRQVGGVFKQICWPTTHSTSLQRDNVGGSGNDEQIKAMEAKFGVI